jgi:hypothetical protein
MLGNWFISKFGSLLAKYGGKAQDREQRRAPRFPARNSSATLAWNAGSEIVFSPLKMVNISRTGLLFVSESPPPADLPVQIRFEDPEATLVDVNIVHISRMSKSPRWIRVVFINPLSDALLNSVIDGPRTTPPPGTPAIQTSFKSSLTLLGLRWPCNSSDVKAAFRQLSMKYHPDRGGSTEDFLALVKAFETLNLACRSRIDAADGRGPGTAEGPPTDLGMGPRASSRMSGPAPRPA